MHIGPKIEMRVVTLGLDDAGKTSILFKLKQNEFIPTIPTIGEHFTSLSVKGDSHKSTSTQVNFQLVDISFFYFFIFINSNKC